MIKIKTDNFKLYSKIVNAITEKGDPRKEKIFLNFKDANVYFSGNDYKAKFPFDYEGVGHDNFWVDANGFLAICNKYKELSLNDYEFSCDRDKFKLPTINQDDYTDFDFNSIKEHEVNLGSILDDLKEASLFSSQVNPLLRGVFLQKGKVIGFNKEKLLINHLETSCEDYDIPLNVLKIILLIQSDNVKIFQGDSKYRVSIDNCDIIIPFDSDLKIYDMDNPALKEVYMHDTSIILDSKELLDAIDFIHNFANNNINNRFVIQVKDNNEIIFKNDEKDCVVEKVVPIKNISEDLIGEEYWVNCVDFKVAATSIIKKEKIDVRLRFPVESEGNKGLCIEKYLEDEESEEVIVRNKRSVLVLLQS